MDLKSKIIIRNYTDLEDYEAISYIRAVISEGKISDNGNHYCYLTTFKSGYCVSTDRRKDGNTHTFYIYKEEK